MSKVSFMEKGFYYGAASADPSNGMESKFISDAILNSNGYFHKSDIEFQRYKQDCRKRALDLAHGELAGWGMRSTSTTAALTLEPKPNVEELADKYYNWLISIPQ